MTNKKTIQTFQPIALGTEIEKDGKKYKVIQNTRTILVELEEIKN